MSKAAKRERQRVNREARRQAEEQWLKRRRMFRVARNVAIPIVLVIAAAVVFSVIRGDDDGGSNGEEAFPPMEIDSSATYEAVMDTTAGTITIELDASAAPTSVNNFAFLARNGFYDGLEVVRAAADFTIQMGSPDNSQSGGPDYSVEAELPTGDPPYPVGTVAWAKTEQDPPGTAGSQFFIITGAGGESLPPEYGLLGTVTGGLEVAQAIAALAPPTGDGPPTQTVTINSITVTEDDNELGPTDTPIPTTVAPNAPESTLPGAPAGT